MLYISGSGWVIQRLRWRPSRCSSGRQPSSFPPCSGLETKTKRIKKTKANCSFFNFMRKCNHKASLIDAFLLYQVLTIYIYILIYTKSSKEHQCQLRTLEVHHQAAEEELRRQPLRHPVEVPPHHLDNAWEREEAKPLIHTASLKEYVGLEHLFSCVFFESLYTNISIVIFKLNELLSILVILLCNSFV